jgi:hypothetical protein
VNSSRQRSLTQILNSNCPSVLKKIKKKFFYSYTGRGPTTCWGISFNA